MDNDLFYYQNQSGGKTPGHETCDFSCENCDNCMGEEQARLDRETERWYHIAFVDQSEHVYCYTEYMRNIEDDDGIPF